MIPTTAQLLDLGRCLNKTVFVGVTAAAFTVELGHFSYQMIAS